MTAIALLAATLLAFASAQTNQRVNGPMGTYWDGEEFRGIFGNILNENFFEWVSDFKYIVYPFARKQVYPPGFTFARGKLIGKAGVYYQGGKYRTLGDKFRTLPANLFTVRNGAFYIKPSSLNKLYPPGYFYKNGGLNGPKGLFYSYNLQNGQNFFFAPGPKSLPRNAFVWRKGAYYLKPGFRNTVIPQLRGDPGYPPGVRPQPPARPRPAPGGNRRGGQAQPPLPAKLPPPFQLVNGRLFGHYGVYRFRGVYRTFGDDFRIVPKKYIYENPNGLFYYQKQFLWALYPRGYNYVNGGIKGPESVFFKRLANTLDGRFYIIPGFRILPAKYFRWFKGGHLIRDRYRWALSKPGASGGSPHIPNSDGRVGPVRNGGPSNNNGPPPLRRTSRRRPGRNGPVVKVVPHTGPRPKFEWLDNKVFGDHNVVYDGNRFWTLGDWGNELLPEWFNVANGKFTLIPGNLWRLYPKGFKWVPGKGLTGPNRIYYQRLPGRSQGTFFYPGGGVVPPFYFDWRQGGFYMKQRFVQFVLEG